MLSRGYIDSMACFPQVFSSIDISHHHVIIVNDVCQQRLVGHLLKCFVDKEKISTIEVVLSVQEC